MAELLCDTVSDLKKKKRSRTATNVALKNVTKRKQKKHFICINAS